MHAIQKVLLSRLVSKNDQSYSSLTHGYDFENNIVFHLKKLSNDGYITKVGQLYQITALGIKEIYAQGLPDLENPEKKTFFCGFVVSDQENNFLIKSHPSAKTNFYNLPSGRPRFGEPMNQALIRLFKDNTKLTLDHDRFHFLSLHAKIVKTPQNEVLFDDGQAIFKVNILNSEKERIKLATGITWMSLDQIKFLPNSWPEIKMCIIDQPVLPYSDYTITSDYKL